MVGSLRDPPAGWRATQTRRGSAFSLVETTVAVLIVGVLLVAALNTIGGSKLSQYKLAERTRGLLLAEALMSEILQQEYEDAGSPGGIGLEMSESGATRADFDDIDDYQGWSASPPQNKDGSLISWADGYRRSVTVEWINPLSLAAGSGTSTGVKGMAVTVEHDGRIVAQVRAFRTSTWMGPVCGE